MTQETRTLGELERELAQAAEKHAQLCKETSMARNRETDALNRLNQIQKAIDARVAELRKGAPRESDWKAAERRREAVECSR